MYDELFLRFVDVGLDLYTGLELFILGLDCGRTRGLAFEFGRTFDVGFTLEFVLMAGRVLELVGRVRASGLTRLLGRTVVLFDPRLVVVVPTELLRLRLDKPEFKYADPRLEALYANPLL